MTPNHTQDVAVVTGGGSGIGRALAIECATQGMGVVVADINEETARDTAQSISAMGQTGIAVHVDVTDLSSVRKLADRSYSEFGSVNFLFNNAGIVVRGEILELTEADWEWIFAVNYWGILNGVRAFAPRMKTQSPSERHIINTSSLAGVATSKKNTAAYHASKFAVTAMSWMLRQELSGYGIGVSILCPGQVATSIFTETGRSRQARFGGPQATAERAASSTTSEWAGPSDGAGYWAGERRLPEEVAPLILRAVRQDRCFIFTHPETRASVESYFASIMQDYDNADADS